MDAKERVAFLGVCDHILRELNNDLGVNNVAEILKKRNLKSDKNTIDRISDKLSGDGFIEIRYLTGDSSVVKILSAGRDFIQWGGYITQLEGMLEKANKADLLSDTTIKANLSNVNSNKWTKIISVIALIISLLSLAISYYGLIKSK